MEALLLYLSRDCFKLTILLPIKVKAMGFIFLYLMGKCFQAHCIHVYLVNESSLFQGELPVYQVAK